jgi:phosphoglycerate dehydrogenase-like enzyme
MSAAQLLVLARGDHPALPLLRHLPADISVVSGCSVDAFRSHAAEADAILVCHTSLELLRQVWRLAPSIRWIHTLSAGLNNVLFPELIESPAILTNARCIYSASLAEFAIGSVLYFAKDFRRMLRNQAVSLWERITVEDVRGRTLGIVGYGSTGEAVARLARALGMRILALRARPELSEHDPVVDEVFGTAARLEMIPRCDYLVIAAPLTAATRRLIGREEIGAMRPNAVIINVGRGEVVDEEALVAALTRRLIRGAALDVFEVEPLPVGHPFYGLENVLLSPHSADHTVDSVERSTGLFLENCGRFLRGEPLLNPVDKQRGY